jgi:hypothetical protein
MQKTSIGGIKMNDYDIPTPYFKGVRETEDSYQCIEEYYTKGDFVAELQEEYDILIAEKDILTKWVIPFFPCTNEEIRLLGNSQVEYEYEECEENDRPNFAIRIYEVYKNKYWRDKNVYL